MYLHPCRADLNHRVAQRWETLVEVETYVLRGLDSTAPVSSTIPTPTLLAEPSMPRTLGILADANGADHLCMKCGRSGTRKNALVPREAKAT